MKFVTKSLINFAFSFKYLRYCKLSRNLIARCDRAFVSLETRYRCVRISARGFRRSRYGIIDPTVFRKLMRLGNATFSAGFHFLFSTVWAWSTSRSPQLIFRSRIVIIAYSDRYGIYQWEHALPECYVTVQHWEAPRCVFLAEQPLSVYSLCVIRIRTCRPLPPTFPNVTFSRCLVTIAPIIYIDDNLHGNFLRNCDKYRA